MRTLVGSLLVGGLVAAGTPLFAGHGDEGGDSRAYVGLGTSLAQPVDAYDDFVDQGIAFGPFGGFMFNRHVGIQADLNFTAHNQDKATDDDDTWTVGGMIGPRLDLPLEHYTLFGIGQVGIYTGLASSSAVTDTSIGFSAGGGIEFPVNDLVSVAGIARYNRLYQRVHRQGDIEFVTGGIQLTFNFRAEEEAPPPAPAEVTAPEREEPVLKKKLVLRGVHFDFDKSDIRADARPVLDEAVRLLKEQSDVLVVAEGHTDAVGTDEYNQKLSERRATAVRNYLTKGGISADRIEAVGFGESKPVASNDTADGRAQNRRVELRVK